MVLIAWTIFVDQLWATFATKMRKLIFPHVLSKTHSESIKPDLTIFFPNKLYEMIETLDRDRLPSAGVSLMSGKQSVPFQNYS